MVFIIIVAAVGIVVGLVGGTYLLYEANKDDPELLNSEPSVQVSNTTGDARGEKDGE